MLGASACDGLITGVPLTIDPFIPTIVAAAMRLAASIRSGDTGEIIEKDQDDDGDPRRADVRVL